MGDPYGLMNRALDRLASAGRGRGRGRGGGRTKLRDPSNPADLAYLRSMHPDFDEIMGSASVDYRTRCQTDANFANKFKIPPVMDPTLVFREHENSVDGVCWGPQEGQLISASHDHTLKVWDASSGRCLDTLKGHTGGVYHCAVAGNRQLLLSCGSGEAKTALLWKWPLRVSTELKGHRRSVIHGSFSSDCVTAVTGDQDGNIIVHDLNAGVAKVQRTLHMGPVNCANFCREEQDILCTTGSDGSLHLVDLREQASSAVWRLPSAAANVVALRTSLVVPSAHDGHAVHAVELISQTAFTGGSDNKMKRWDLRMPTTAAWDPSCLGEYLGHTAPVRSLAVSEDLRYVVTGCEDGSCRIWPTDPLGKVRASLKELRAEVMELEPKTQDETLAAEVRKSHETRRQKLRYEIAEAKEVEDRLMRDGYTSAVKSLTGTTGLISAVAWKEDSSSKSASILAASWDQNVRLYEVSLKDLQV